jgi:hypothetical protein
MSRAIEQTTRGAPWYRCFWPWFIVVLLATAVTASISTVVIAVSGSDSLVRDDYFRDGVAINRRLAREATASRMGIGAELRFDAMTGDLQLQLHGVETEGLETLDLALSHPTQAERDLEVTLRRGADDVFRAALDTPLQGRWYVSLSPSVPQSASREAADAGTMESRWRLTETIALSSNRPISLGAPP